MVNKTDFPTVAETDTTIFKGWFDADGQEVGDSITVAAGEQTYTASLVNAVAKIDTVKFETLAAAAAEAENGDTITLLANVDGFATLTTAAATLDLNGQQIGAYAGALKITFTGDELKTVKNGEFCNYKDGITITASKDLTITGVTSHQEITTVGTGTLNFLSSEIKADIDTNGEPGETTADVDHAYYSFGLAVGKFTKTVIQGNKFAQPRRCCLQLTNVPGEIYVYDNTFDGTKCTVSKAERTDGKKFGAMQIYAQGGAIFIENNTFEGEWIAEPFTMYNEWYEPYKDTPPLYGRNYITDKPVVFNSNTVKSGVPYLWDYYLSPDNGGVKETNTANIVFGDLSGVDDLVDHTKGQYKTYVQDCPDYVEFKNMLALPAGISYCKDFAGDYYVNDEVVEFANIKAGDTVIVLPGASLESETLAFTLVEGFKNKYTVAAAGAPLPPEGGKKEVDMPSDADPAAVIAKSGVTVGVATPVAADLEAAGVSEETYKGYFAPKATFNATSGKWDVTVDFLPAVQTEIQTAVDAAAADIVDAIGDATATQATVATKPGLYYGLVSQGAVEGINTAKPASFEMATGTTMTFDLNKTAPAQFFKVVCSPVGNTVNAD